ncbi:hypothetical protein DdX_10020 [Ditylenchus destructor]|uniref:Uncharacterized protein n=1 Tax=Ditylenchus destructor TaxID=166010 RepID=A0AAD4MZC7_9BILA|nr:hypothetical protein DdX_10020 [Ditylenchus destructor]
MRSIVIPVGIVVVLICSVNAEFQHHCLDGRSECDTLTPVPVVGYLPKDHSLHAFTLEEHLSFNRSSAIMAIPEYDRMYDLSLSLPGITAVDVWAGGMEASNETDSETSHYYCITRRELMLMDMLHFALMKLVMSLMILNYTLESFARSIETNNDL